MGKMARLSDLRGIGPSTETMLHRADITSVETLRELGPIEAYVRLRFVNEHVSINALYALAAGLEGRDWRSLSDAERQALRAELPEGLV